MAIRASKKKIDYYELNCGGNNLKAYVYCGFIIAVEPDGAIRKIVYNKEFFDGCKTQHRVVTLDVIHGHGKDIIVLPDGHTVPIP